MSSEIHQNFNYSINIIKKLEKIYNSIAWIIFKIIKKCIVKYIKKVNINILKCIIY